MEQRNISKHGLTRRQAIVLAALTVGGIAGFLKYRSGRPLTKVWYTRSDDPLSGLALAGSTLVSIALPDILVRLDPHTGQQVKRVSLPPTSNGNSWGLRGCSDQSLILSDAVEIIGADAITGAAKWKVMQKDCQHSVLGDRLVAACPGQLLCLTVGTGQKQWKYSLPQCAIKDLCCSANRVVVALDTTPGKVLLLDAEHGTLIKTLSIAADSLWSSANDIVAYNPESGECQGISSNGDLLWRWTASNSGGESSEQAYGDDTGSIYLQSATELKKVSRGAGKTLWTRSFGDHHITCPLPVGKFLVVGSGYGNLSLIGRDSGEKVDSLDLATLLDHASIINQYGVGSVTTLLASDNDFYACSGVGAIARLRVNSS
jgi:outer membrane protein assembly factor BamB